MAGCLFGDPITDETLKAMAEYKGKQITKRDRAHVALIFKNSGEKDVNVKRCVEKLKSKWGTGVSTLCMVYNATGDPIKFHIEHDWNGHIGPDPCPPEIANGQWGGFLHVKTSGTATGSNAAVVYRGTNETGKECDLMVAWENPWNRISFGNKVYTQIREAGSFDNNWDTIENIMAGINAHNYLDTWNGCKSIVTIGEDSSPTLCAEFTLAPEPYHATLKLK